MLSGTRTSRLRPPKGEMFEQGYGCQPVHHRRLSDSSMFRRIFGGSLVNELQSDVLSSVAEKSVRRVIVDLSAVYAIESEIFRSLREMAAMIELMGKDSVFTGFQPGVASAVVELFPDADTIRTAASVEEGIEVILQDED